MAHLYTATGHISYAKSASLYLQLMLDLEIMNPFLHQKFSEKGCLLFGKEIHFGQALVWFNNGTNNNESIEKESWNNTWVLVTLTEEILNGKFHFLCSFPCKRAGYHQWKEERGRQYNPQTQDVNWTYNVLYTFNLRPVSMRYQILNLTINLAMMKAMLMIPSQIVIMKTVMMLIGNVHILLNQFFGLF